MSKMRLSWRLGLRVLLTLVALALAWRWIGIRWNARTSAPKPIADLATTTPLNQAGGDAAPADAYEVYSALYQAPMQEPLAFSENSATDIPQVDGSCLKPETPDEREITDAFVAANRQSHRWEQKFSIAQGYKLLPRSEVTQVQSCVATHGRDGAQCAAYQQIKYVRFLGVPGFDHAHTRALVSVIKSCGDLCGSGGIFAIEKAGETWKRSATTNFTRDCSWVY